MPNTEINEKSKTSSIVNVASIPQRSPFRYPGGKTWLIPIVRRWLRQDETSPNTLIEPFAGGAIVSLTAAFESLVNKVVMVERDEEVAAVWETILGKNNNWLANRIYEFELSHENVNAEFEKADKTARDIAFCTILKNRTFHGGIITRGSGFLKNGENGKGIASRWYAKTLRNRILAIDTIKEKINFISGDAFEIIQYNLLDTSTYFFIDPPYTVAAKRLYTYFDINHEQLFRLATMVKGKFMLTYDDTPEIRQLAERYNLNYRSVPMKTTHHLEKNEIIISDNFNWWSNRGIRD